jgi:hypothetical protein
LIGKKCVFAWMPSQNQNIYRKYKQYAGNSLGAIAGYE